MQEPNNTQAEILKIHPTSSQCHVKYENFNKQIKYMWINKCELFTITKPKDAELSDFIYQDKNSTVFSQQFDRTGYNRLMCEFEQFTAEEWCNTRRMIKKLSQEFCMEDKSIFSILEERFTVYLDHGGSELNFYQELLFEALDELFTDFCANSFQIHIDRSSQSYENKLKYMAQRGFKEYIGILQIWFRERMQDELGHYFCKILQTLDPSTIHLCQEFICLEHCTHDCCFQLLKYQFNKHQSMRKFSDSAIRVNCVVQRKSCLGKRAQDQLDKYDEISDSNSDITYSQPNKRSLFSEFHTDNLFISIPLKSINYRKGDSSLNKSYSLRSNDNINVNEDFMMLIDQDSHIQTKRGIKKSKLYFLPVNKEWRIGKWENILNYLAKIPKGPFKDSTTGKHCLESCIVSEKISIIPDGNCLFRALSWWITGDENMHGQIRSELITFMSTASLCKNM